LIIVPSEQSIYLIRVFQLAVYFEYEYKLVFKSSIADHDLVKKSFGLMIADHDLVKKRLTIMDAEVSTHTFLTMIIEESVCFLLCE
jgi:hypothetical protein